MIWLLTAAVFIINGLLLDYCIRNWPGRKAQRAQWEADHPGLRWEDWKHVVRGRGEIILMYENAPVQHVKFKWLGRVERSPDGRFYNPGTIRFWVRWESGSRAVQNLDIHSPSFGGITGVAQLPEPGWYPGADIVRLIT